MEPLSDGALDEIRQLMAQRIREGLAADGHQIKALNAHLRPPDATLTGDTLVVDVGGTNMRAALVTIENGRATITKGPTSARLALNDGMTTRERFFGAQAELAKKLEPAPGLPVGYCFSYPSDVQPSLDARLIRWTKGIDIPNVEGTLVGEGLAEALRAHGIPPKHVHVLNDTIASMLGGALDGRGPGTNVIGLIAGTGSNLAAFFESSEHAKLTTSNGPVAINLESGNFAPPHLLEADDLVDAESANAGAQRFEKAVAGFYLPYVYAKLRPAQAFDPAIGSGELVRRRDEDGDTTAAMLLSRAANLVAIAIAAIADVQNRRDPIVIVAEGSLFWGDPQFRPQVEARLSSLRLNRTHEIRHVQDANLIGSACAALGRPM